MKLRTNSQGLRGTITVPGDKSISHRAVILGSMAYGKTRVQGILKSEDVLATIAAFSALGVTLSWEEGALVIDGHGPDAFAIPRNPIYLGNSGTSMRLLSGALAHIHGQLVLTGDDSLSQRPMDRVTKPLRQMGLRISGEGQKEKAPLIVTGNPSLQAIDYTLPQASAQVKSALILAALQARGTTTITEPITTRNHTEELLPLFGGEIAISDKTISVTGPQRLTATTLTVPGDISSAAFWLVAGVIVPHSHLTLRRVGINPTRTGLLDVLRRMGASMTIHTIDKNLADITVETSSLVATEISGEEIPRLIDELPIIALLATQAKGVTTIRDAGELRIKETDRIAMVETVLTRMGADVTALQDGFIIYGPSSLQAARIATQGDHRIGMMAAIASLLVKTGPVILEGAEMIATSYPEFFDDMAYLERD